ncbi:MAG: Bax inhibitor-1/YccA family protein [Bacteroidota bacterium]
MNDNNLQKFDPNNPLSFEIGEKELAKNFMSQVFAYMTAALALSGIAAFVFANSSLIYNLFNPVTGSLNILGWVTMLAPLGLVLLMGVRYHKMSFGSLMLFFLVFAVINGISLSFILLTYTASSIALTFFVTAGTFAVMAILGWRTRTDLTKFGSILYMALIGIIIASLANFFLQSGPLDYIISFAGVIIFTGLTAYDVQKLKRIGAQVEYGTEGSSKMAIMGAVSLYLDFINLFLFLLRFLGSRD